MKVDPQILADVMRRAAEVHSSVEPSQLAVNPGVLVEVQERGLIVRASSRDVSFRGFVATESEASPTTATLPSFRLLPLFNCPDNWSSGSVEILEDRARFRFDETVQIDVKTTKRGSPPAFEPLPQVKMMVVPSFGHLISSVSWARFLPSAGSIVSGWRAGICLGPHSISCTDKFKAGLVPFETGILEPITLPLKPLNRVLTGIDPVGEVQIGVERGQLFLSPAPHLHYRVLTDQDAYPAVETLFADIDHVDFTVPREQLLTTVRRAAGLSDFTMKERALRVRLDIGQGAAEVSTVDAAGGSYRDMVPIEGPDFADPVELQAPLLIDAISHLRGREVTMSVPRSIERSDIRFNDGKTFALVGRLIPS